MSGRKSSSSSKPLPDAADKASATTSQTRSSVQTSSSGQPGRSTHDAAALPEMFGRYKIERELGKGAMGIVYLAEDTQLGRKVALKIPQRSALEDPAALDRFYREAKTSSQIRHSHICPVYDVGAIDGTHYLTMAYIPGKPISSFLGKGKLPSARAVASLFRKLAMALAEAHKQGVVHRDLKPSNVMLDDRNEPIIMDFGLARQMNTAENARITQSGAIVGTPAYMAPEQVKGDGSSIGPQCDIYSLGVMLYQFLTGELPFDGPVMMVLAQIMTAEPAPPAERRPDVDPQLESICLTMMAREPGQRYATMNDVAAALSSYLKGTAEGPVLSSHLNSNLASTAGQSRLSQSLKSVANTTAVAKSGRKTFLAWGIGIAGGLVTIGLLGTLAVRMSRPSQRGESRSPETIEVAGADLAPGLIAASDGETPGMPNPSEQQTTTESLPRSHETPVPDANSAGSSDIAESSSGPPPNDSEDSLTEPPDQSMKGAPAPPATPTVPVVTTKRPPKEPAKAKGRGSARKNPPPNRGSAGKKSSQPRTAVAPGNRTTPPTAPSPELDETEKTFAQYEQAIQKAHEELASRFDKTIKDIEKSTKLIQEEKTRILAELQVEKGTFLMKEFIPFSTRMRKYAEAYCLAMDKAEDAAWDRLKRYGASPEDIEAAQERMIPRLVGVWQCESVGKRFELRLMSNLKLESDVESRQGSWTFDEESFNLKFPDSKAPGGIWHYKCKMTTSGRGFTASHAKAPEIKGVIPD